ncbi:MAG: FKBP-type peptidyl-prolyl cis-trans isomerase [Gammaproteobacteria bacterium]|nr:FKBP-type peptidyl-prolyl cis-trans isomerase [Gammaproteobacteria bacterium]
MQKITKNLTWSIIIFMGCQAPTEDAQPSEQAEQAEVALDGDIAKASYSIGYAMGENIGRRFSDSIELEHFVQGAHDGLSGAVRLVAPAEGQQALAALNEKREALKAAKAALAASAGAEFLVENAKKEEVVTLPSGLQYEVLIQGDGSMPAPTDTVLTHYHGTLVNGDVFDSSVERGEPAAFPVNRVIAGWTEALQLMAVGSKWRLYVPPGLAYGNRAQATIPANSTLIFEVELLEIQ